MGKEDLGPHCDDKCYKKNPTCVHLLSRWRTGKSRIRFEETARYIREQEIDDKITSF